jgi:hypothetical protein
MDFMTIKREYLKEMEKPYFRKKQKKQREEDSLKNLKDLVAQREENLPRRRARHCRARLKTLMRLKPN